MQVRLRIFRPPATPALVQGRASATSSARPALGASSRVALGILISKLTGLVRERFIGHYFGIETVVADAFRAAYRIPNLLSVLFGEGVLSASFVTVYSKLRARGEDAEAEHVAQAVFGILSILSAVLVLLGILFTPVLTAAIAPGFTGEKRALTARIVRILFPSTGILVMSAWCLGVLNSHRRFLLSYLAPVALNLTVIVVLFSLGSGSTQNQLVLYAAWAWVAGGCIQFLVQLPRVLQVLPGFRPLIEWRSPHVRSVIRNFGPIFLSRGVVQVSALADQIISSYLPPGAVAALATGQVISTLPIGLFSMSVAAAELPALSSAVGTHDEIAEFLRNRLASGLRRIAFFIIPSAVAFLVLGDVVTGILYQTGRFTHQDSIYVWSVLAGSSVGLLASSLGRLYSSAFYALLDTRTPLRFAVIRVALTIILGLIFALLLPRWLGIDPKWGIAGLTASAGIAGWVEFTLLRRTLNQRIGDTGIPADFTLKLWSVAFAGGLLGYGVKLLLNLAGHPVLLALVVLPIYGIVYFAGAIYLQIEEASAAIRSVTSRLF